MIIRRLEPLALALLLAACGNKESEHAAPGATAAQFDSAQRMKFPADYRKWVFLSSGHGMSYSPAAAGATDPPFDNVFVDPVSYEIFLKTGRWREGTVLVLEIRGGQSKGSINKQGAFQIGEPIAVEVHVKDSSRFPGGWAFFSFDGQRPVDKIPNTAGCYSCHQQNAAVDTTFVQFYPTLLPIAQQNGTFAKALRGEGFRHPARDEAATPVVGTRS
jgi:hypothetical protein